MIPKKILDEIKLWIDEGRYGSIQINFQNGKILNYNITQSLKVDFIMDKTVADGIKTITASSYQSRDL